MKVKENPTLITTLQHNLTFATDAEVNEALVTKYRNYELLFTYDEDNTACYQSVINDWAPYVNELYLTTQYEYDPIENYHRNEKYKGGESTTYGRKDSRATNVKESTETDLKTEHNVDSKSAVNADMKTEHGRNEVRTPNLTDTSVHSDSGYDNSVGTESSRDEVTRTGSETVNATAALNFDQSIGDEDDNFTHNTADAADNYDRIVADKTNNYRETIGSAAENYSQLSGKDSSAKNYELEAYGNIGTMSTQDMIRMERDIIINVLAFYVEKFSKCFNVKIDGLYD